MVSKENKPTFIEEIVYKQKEMMMKQNDEFMEYLSTLVNKKQKEHYLIYKKCIENFRYTKTKFQL